MQDKNDDVSILQIPRRWFNFFSIVFIAAILAFTIFDPLFKVKVFQDFLDSRWLHRGSVLMTLIIGYIFVVARSLHRFTLKDSNRRYEEGRKVEREIIIKWLEHQAQSRLRDELLEKLKEGDDDP